jgi:phosphohistidine swiveling domain-containing protein
MDREKIIHEKWIIQGFDGCANYINHASVSGLVDCYEKVGFGYTKFLLIIKGHFVEFHYLTKDIESIGNKVWQRYERDKRYITHLMANDATENQETYRLLEYIGKLPLPELSKDEIIDIYQQVWKAYHTPLGYGHLIEPIVWSIEPQVKEEICQATGLTFEDKALRQMFTRLLEPKKPSFIGLQEITLAKLTKEFLQARVDFARPPEDILGALDKELLDRLRQHQRTSIYNQMNYHDGEPLTPLHYLKEMAHLAREDLDALLVRLEERYEDNERERQAIMAKHGFSPSLRDRIDILIDVLHWQDDRKMFMLTCVYHLNRLLKEIARRYGHQLEDLKTLLPMEVTAERLASFTRAEGESRRRLSAYYLERVEGRLRTAILTGKEAKELEDALRNDSALQDLHGSSASLGKAMGKVVICLTKDDIGKVGEGDVLVASMTRPEFVPAMKKAAAIVTDEGGITCHAAIVSRELQKPCIIGTKKATRILKDGDLVEVDANHGIVRKIPPGEGKAKERKTDARMTSKTTMKIPQPIPRTDMPLSKEGLLRWTEGHSFLFEHGDLSPAYFEMTMINFSKPFKGLPSYDLGFSYVEHDEGDYISPIDNHARLGRLILERFVGAVPELHAIHGRWRERFEELQERYYLYYQKEYATLSVDELLRMHDEIYRLFIDVGIPGFIDGFNFHVEGLLTTSIQRFAQEHDLLSHELSATLLQSGEESCIRRRERNLRSIVKGRGYENIAVADIDLQDAAFKDHQRRYSYTFSDYSKHVPYTDDLLRKEIAELRSTEERTTNELFALLKERYALPEVLADTVALVLAIGKWQDERKEYSQMYVSLNARLLFALAQKTGIDYEVFRDALHDEVRPLVGRELDIEEVSRRQDGVLFVYGEGERLFTFTGSEAKELRRLLQGKTDEKEADHLQGVSASPGEAKGTVRILMSAKEIGRMQRGDILVAPMTRPEYLPAMKLAGAIVTDDGGITSHAAIVARELGVPCIVGTKKATRTLKDGDLVEVDASHGIVRRLSTHT